MVQSFPTWLHLQTFVKEQQFRRMLQMIKQNFFDIYWKFLLLLELKLKLKNTKFDWHDEMMQWL